MQRQSASLPTNAVLTHAQPTHSPTLLDSVLENTVSNALAQILAAPRGASEADVVLANEIDMLRGFKAKALRKSYSSVYNYGTNRREYILDSWDDLNSRIWDHLYEKRQRVHAAEQAERRRLREIAREEADRQRAEALAAMMQEYADMEFGALLDAHNAAQEAYDYDKAHALNKILQSRGIALRKLRCACGRVDGYCRPIYAVAE